MFKISFICRILQVRVITCIFVILSIYAVYKLFDKCPSYNYDHLPAEVFETHLLKQTTPNLKVLSNKPHCRYDEIIKSTKSLTNWEAQRKYNNFSPKDIVNGSYSPQHCSPLISVAIIVPYRNRKKQLDIFIPYIHNFLRKQNIHYRIYLIEQTDKKPLNKAMMINIAAAEAMKDKFPCLIVHDVDMLPLDDANLYACCTQPRHLSASVDTLRYVLPYDYLVGGVIAIPADVFVTINGFSNKFQYWGGEDDDVARRFSWHSLEIIRFPIEMSRYTMVTHPPSTRNPKAKTVWEENQQVFGILEDGLSTLPHYSMQIKPQPLYVYITVQLYPTTL